MDKERATGLLLSAKVFELAWEVDCDDEGFYGQFAIVQSATNAEKEEEDFSYRCVAGEFIGPTLPEAQLMAAAPELARWGIELAAEVDEGLNERAHLQIELAEARGEVERLRAEAAQLRADRAVLLASAVVTYGAEALPTDPEERRRAMNALLGQLPHQPGDPAVTDLIREMFVRAAVEAPPEVAP